MKILELFSGTECLSNAFRARGHECFTVDWDTRFPSSLHIDIMQLTAGRILADVRQWRDTVQRLGYHSSWVVLNARDIGIDPTLGPVPQNRERLFMLSWRDDLGLPDQFPWPQPQALTRTIADVLDEDVADSFFLKPESVISFLTRNEQGDRCLYRVSDHLPTPDEVRQWVRETTN